MNTQYKEACRTKATREYHAGLLAERFRSIAPCVEVAIGQETDGPRELTVEAKVGPFSVSISLEGVTPLDAFLAHWNIQTRSPEKFTSPGFALAARVDVNRAHHCKATGVYSSFEECLECTARGLAVLVPVHLQNDPLAENHRVRAPFDIFVFGSNLAGIHGAGAAAHAHKAFDAAPGEGVGATGRAYAIPTKDERIETLPLSRIKPHVDVFVDYAANHQHLSFGLTHVGCGLAGYDWDLDIRPLFPATLPPNITILDPI